MHKCTHFPPAVLRIAIGAILGLLLPTRAYAQDAVEGIVLSIAGVQELLILGAFLLVSMVLTKVLVGAVHIPIPNSQSLPSRKKDLSLPVNMVIGTVVGTAVIWAFAFKTVGGIAPFDGPHGLRNLLWFFMVAGLVCIGVQLKWKSAKDYVFAFAVATIITFVLLGVKHMFFEGRMEQSPFLMTIVIVIVIGAWRFLFGPWAPHVKATVLGTFILWLGIHLFSREVPEERLAHALSIIVALIPALVWCLLFLDFHRQRRSLVLLMFFSGMIATAPILFYDMLVRRGVELQFFLFRITPENFSRVSGAFVSGNAGGMTNVQTTLIATLISFMIVGLIEEISKFWALRESGKQFFSSIDDVMQLAIIVAIGFAFAENVINPTYFLSFVKENLIYPPTPNWSAFLGNVMGRSILTTMVHVLSGGVLGYFFGLAIFADPYMRDVQESGKEHRFALFIHSVLRLPKKSVFRRQVMAVGILIAVVLHGAFNFLVTLQDVLPGNPRTLGDLFGSPSGSMLHIVSILLVPSLFYVVGGFWLLTTLLLREESKKEHGRLVVSDTFVKNKAFA